MKSDDLRKMEFENNINDKNIIFLFHKSFTSYNFIRTVNLKWNEFNDTTITILIGNNESIFAISSYRVFGKGTDNFFFIFIYC